MLKNKPSFKGKAVIWLGVFLPMIGFCFHIVLGGVIMPVMAQTEIGSSFIIELSADVIEPGEPVDLTIYLYLEEGKSYAAGSFLLSYDAAKLQLDPSSFVIGSQLFGVANTNEPGVVRFNGVATTGAEGLIELATAQFEGGGPGASAILIEPQGEITLADGETISLEPVEIVVEVEGDPLATPLPQPSATVTPLPDSATPVPTPVDRNPSPTPEPVSNITPTPFSAEYELMLPMVFN